jgi:hypothetical protein
MAYATAEQLRGYLEQVDASEDAFLETILERATTIVDGVLRFSFAAYGAASDEDVYCDGTSIYLDLPQHEAASVSAVAQISGKGTSSETTEAVTDYEELGDGRLYREAGWTKGVWYRVTAAWGYGPAPEDVVEVTLEVARNIYLGRNTSSTSNVVGANGEGAVQYNRALTWAQLSVLENVRALYLGPVHA